MVDFHNYGRMWMHPWGNTVDHEGDVCARADDHDDMVRSKENLHFNGNYPIYRMMLYEIFLMAFIEIINTKGLSTEPCGTAQLIDKVEDGMLI